MTDHEPTPEAGLSEEAIAAAAEEIAESVMGNSSLENYLSDEERDDLRSDIAIEATRVLTGLRLPTTLNFAAGVEAAAKAVDEYAKHVESERDSVTAVDLAERIRAISPVSPPSPAAEPSEPVSNEALAALRFHVAAGNTLGASSAMLYIGQLIARIDAMAAAELSEAKVATNAARDVLVERERQIEIEGWTVAHDDAHRYGELAMAAACYALTPSWRKTLINIVPLLSSAELLARLWPWDAEWWKPSDRRRDLIKAGALILAEIERLDRAAAHARASQQGKLTAGTTRGAG